MAWVLLSNTLPGKLSQEEWEEEFLRRLAQADYEYEILHSEECFREALHLMDLENLERERAEYSKARLVEEKPEDTSDQETEYQTEPWYNWISWLGGMMFPESCFSR